MVFPTQDVEQPADLLHPSIPGISSLREILQPKKADSRGLEGTRSVLQQAYCQQKQRRGPQTLNAQEDLGLDFMEADFVAAECRTTLFKGS